MRRTPNDGNIGCGVFADLQKNFWYWRLSDTVSKI